MSAESTLAFLNMYVTKCLFQSSNIKRKLETCRVRVQNCVNWDVRKRIFTNSNDFYKLVKFVNFYECSNDRPQILSLRMRVRIPLTGRGTFEDILGHVRACRRSEDVTYSTLFSRGQQRCGSGCQYCSNLLSLSIFDSRLSMVNIAQGVLFPSSDAMST